MANFDLGGPSYPLHTKNPVALTVSDIERLAKAGVTMQIEHVIPMADPPRDELRNVEDCHRNLNHLSRSLMQRWLQTKRARHSNDYFTMDGLCVPWSILATQHGDKVWVSVHPLTEGYEPFQLTDEAVIFPSDALMAKLALWEKEHP